MAPLGIVLYLLPGLALAWLGERLRTDLANDRLLARVGVRLMQLSALGFAMQGLFAPVRASAASLADAASLATRLHALGWSLWWIASLSGGVLLGIAARQGRVFGMACVAAALFVPTAALAGPAWLGSGAATWLANAVWAAWWAFALLRRPRAVAGDGALR